MNRATSAGATWPNSLPFSGDQQNVGIGQRFHRCRCHREVGVLRQFGCAGFARLRIIGADRKACLKRRSAIKTAGASRTSSVSGLMPYPQCHDAANRRFAAGLEQRNDAVCHRHPLADVDFGGGVSDTHGSTGHFALLHQ